MSKPLTRSRRSKRIDETPGDYMSRQQVADMLGISIDQVQRWIQRMGIIQIDLSAGTGLRKMVRVRRSDVLAAIERSKVDSAGPELPRRRPRYIGRYR